MNESVASPALKEAVEYCRKNPKPVILTVALVLVSAVLMSMVIPQLTVVSDSAPQYTTITAGVDKEVVREGKDGRAEPGVTSNNDYWAASRNNLREEIARLTEKLGAEAKKRKDSEAAMEQMAAEYKVAFADTVSLVDPDVTARHVLAAKRSRGGEVLPFWKAYTKAFWAAQKSMGFGVYTKDMAFHAVKSLLFANDAIVLDGLWRSVTFVTSVGTVALSYQKELSLFARYPKLLARSPVVVPPQESGAPTFAWLRQHLSEPYDMAKASDQELEDAHFFLKFLIRKDEEFGPGVVQVVLNITQEVVEVLPKPALSDSVKEQPAHMKF